MSKNIITSLCWIKKQHVKKIPDELKNDSKMSQLKAFEEELKLNSNLTGNETLKELTQKFEDTLIEKGTHQPGNIKENAIEEENAEDEFDSVPTFSSEFKQLKEGEKGSKNDKYPDAFDELSEDEEEDYTIHPSDNLIICATAQDDISNLEVYIYDEGRQNLFVHHDILLSSYPLCLEWLSLDEDMGSKANFAVVGSFLPDIEIWNLDALDVLEPEMILGDPANADRDSYYKKLKKHQIEASKDSKYHTDAVLSISLNPFDKKIIASGSADTKVILWDLIKTQPLVNYREHFDKVQCVKFNKKEDNVLLTAGYDHSIKLFDIRSQSSSTQLKVNQDIESIDFSPINKYKFLVSYETGLIEEYDITNMASPLFSYQAHKKAATSISYSSQKEGLFVSCSIDCHVKVWDSISASKTAEPLLLAEKFLKRSTGELFCSKFAEDLDYTVAVGGSKGELLIWQLEQSKTFCDRYGLKWLGDNMLLTDEANNLSKKKLMSNRIKLKSNTGAGSSSTRIKKRK